MRSEFLCAEGAHRDLFMSHPLRVSLQTPAMSNNNTHMSDKMKPEMRLIEMHVSFACYNLNK